MLTTEVVKGLLAGKEYCRFTENNNRITIKFYNETVMMKLGEFPWREMIFELLDLQGDWKEVTEWQEIDWKEAVDCEDENIPLQFLSNIGSEWMDKEKPFENCSFSFVRDHKWRKKVDGKDA